MGTDGREHSAILLTIKLPVVIKTFVFSIFEWSFYTGFTVFALFSSAGMFNTPGMSSLLGQMSQNPQLMQNMLQAPYMQAMLESMSSNPALAEQVNNYLQQITLAHRFR